MKRSTFIFSLLFCSLLLVYTNSIYSQLCSCKIIVCSCCEEERTYQIYYLNGTPYGSTFTTSWGGCAPQSGAFSLPCFTSFYIEEQDVSCSTPLRVYFTACPCTSGGDPDHTILVPCCDNDSPKGHKHDEGNSTPKEFKLKQNFPNPFNPHTKISFDIPAISWVKISIYDINGKLIDTPINSNLAAGTHEIFLDAEKIGLASGIYVYKMEAGTYTEERKMVLIK